MKYIDPDLIDFNKDEPLGKFRNEMEFAFRNLWADNANGLSFLYTGTDALKTEFTRYGKVSLKGKLKDGYSSLYRYVKNNFVDVDN